MASWCFVNFSCSVAFSSRFPFPLLVALFSLATCVELRVSLSHWLASFFKCGARAPAAFSKAVWTASRGERTENPNGHLDKSSPDRDQTKHRPSVPQSSPFHFRATLVAISQGYQALHVATNKSLQWMTYSFASSAATHSVGPNNSGHCVGSKPFRILSSTMMKVTRIHLHSVE